MTDGTRYLNFGHFLEAASVATGLSVETVRAMTNRNLAESALTAPAAGFEDYDHYPTFAAKVAVLLQRIASNHAITDGNKRTALLCAIVFANLNGWNWIPPASDAPNGDETVEIVLAAAAGHLPLAALEAWVDLRLEPLESAEHPEVNLEIFPIEFVGLLPYQENKIILGDLVIDDIHGYNPASVFVRRVSGKTEGISVTEVVISVIGDGYAQEELDVENMEAERYPLGPKECWRQKMVGKYRYGADNHLMTNEDFEDDWSEQ